MRNRTDWSGADHVQNAGGIGKGHQTNSGFSAQRTTRSATGRIHNALRLKLHGAPVALKASLFYSSAPPLYRCVMSPGKAIWPAWQAAYP